MRYPVCYTSHDDTCKTKSKHCFLANPVLMSIIKVHPIQVSFLHVGYQIDVAGSGTIPLVSNEKPWMRDFPIGHVSSFLSLPFYAVWDKKNSDLWPELLYANEILLSFWFYCWRSGTKLYLHIAACVSTCYGCLIFLVGIFLVMSFSRWQ